jgi:hypothetical protein
MHILYKRLAVIMRRTVSTVWYELCGHRDTDDLNITHFTRRVKVIGNVAVYDRSTGNTKFAVYEKTVEISETAPNVLSTLTCGEGLLYWLKVWTQFSFIQTSLQLHTLHLNLTLLNSTKDTGMK